MIEVGDGPGFGQVFFGIVHGGNSKTMRYLDRHVTLQLLIMSEVDHSESPLSQNAFNSVTTDLLGGLENVGCIAFVACDDVRFFEGRVSRGRRNLPPGIRFVAVDQLLNALDEPRH